MTIKNINPGIAMGTCLVIDRQTQIKPPKKDLVHELNRYYQAKEEIITSLVQNQTANPHETEIKEVQLALIKDPVIEKEVVERIKRQDICALDSVDEIYEKYVQFLKQSQDDYLKERTLDFVDIKMRLINQMYDDVAEDNIDCHTILVSKHLYPSMILNMNALVKGVISFEGSSLTHSAILVREKNLPYMIVDSFDAKTGDYLIVDAFKGIIHINPSEEIIKQYMEKIYQTNQIEHVEYRRENYHLGLNISTKVDEQTLKSSNNDGVSLFRSEFLYLRHQTFPSRSEQHTIYEHLLKHAYPKEVVIRTYDIGDDKQLQTDQISTKGLNLFFNQYKEVFELQLDVLIDLYQTYDNLRILLPMVKDTSELRLVEKIVKELQDNRKIPPIGIMLETKEAYEALESFKVVDFISIGSNDLGEALFHVKRDYIKDFNEYVDLMAKPIKKINDFSKKHQIACTVCGGIAANSYGIKRLLELGVTSFGVPTAFINEANLAIQRHEKSIEKK